MNNIEETITKRLRTNRKLQAKIEKYSLEDPATLNADQRDSILRLDGVVCVVKELEVLLEMVTKESKASTVNLAKLAVIEKERQNSHLVEALREETERKEAEKLNLLGMVYVISNVKELVSNHSVTDSQIFAMLELRRVLFPQESVSDLAAFLKNSKGIYSKIESQSAHCVPGTSVSFRQIMDLVNTLSTAPSEIDVKFGRLADEVTLNSESAKIPEKKAVKKVIERVKVVEKVKKVQADEVKVLEVKKKYVLTKKKVAPTSN